MVSGVDGGDDHAGTVRHRGGIGHGQQDGVAIGHDGCAHGVVSVVPGGDLDRRISQRRPREQWLEGAEVDDIDACLQPLRAAPCAVELAHVPLPIVDGDEVERPGLVAREQMSERHRVQSAGHQGDGAAHRRSSARAVVTMPPRADWRTTTSTCVDPVASATSWAIREARPSQKMPSSRNDQR